MTSRRAYVLATRLFGSGAVAQAFGFLATAFAATRTGPEDFAVFAAVTAASAVLGSVNSLAAESRVPVVSRVRAESMNRAGFAATVFCAVVCGLAGAVGILSGEAWSEVALFSSWCSFMLGLQHLLVGIVLRTERQELLARNRLVQGISNAGLIVVLILAAVPGYLALSLAWGVSLALGNAVLLPHVAGWGPGFRRASLHDLRGLFREVRWQPVANVLGDSVGQMPLLLLPMLGAPAISGAWALANRFLMPVVNMAQITLQPIYYGRAAALLRGGDPASFLEHRRVWSLRLGIGAVPVVLGCYVTLQWLIPLFGEEWRVSRMVLLPACLFFPMVLSWLPISQALILSGHLRIQFVWTVGQFVVAALPFAFVPLGWIAADQALTAWATASVTAMAIHRILQRREPNQR